MDPAIEQAINTTKQFAIEITSPLWEITYHIASHSVTCHPAAVTFSGFTTDEAGTQFSNLGDARLS